MSFRSSSMKLSDLKTAVENLLQKSIDNYTLVKAVNNALNVYQPIEARYESGRYTKYTDSISLTSSGYDLANITDLWKDSEGLVVYRDQIRDTYELPRRNRGSQSRGYELRADGKIYPVPSTSSYTAYVGYLAKPDRFSVSSIDLDQYLPIELEVEEMFEDFVLERYFRRKSQPAMAQEAEARFTEKLSKFFNQRATRVHAL